MKMAGRTGGLSDEQLTKKIINTMIDEKLIVNYGREKKIKVQPHEVDKRIEQIRERMNLDPIAFEQAIKRQGLTMERFRKNMEDQVLADKVMSYEIRSQVQIAPEAMEDYFNEHKEYFKTPVKLKVRHILLTITADMPERVKNVIHTRIKEIRQEILQGDMSFAEAARNYSEGPSNKNGGDLGEVKRGMMVKPFEDVLFSLKVGEVSHEVLTRFGYHLILVEDRKESQMPNFADVKREVENRMYKEMLNEVREEWLASIKKTAFVDIKSKANR